ncbi:MAG: hypothetical protein COA79_21590 [Planctomycetota bacterium]|nr:MAG: hypothetical protein COA79_21590 [Planctomycetota bacterium]
MTDKRIKLSNQDIKLLEFSIKKLRNLKHLELEEIYDISERPELSEIIYHVGKGTFFSIKKGDLVLPSSIEELQERIRCIYEIYEIPMVNLAINKIRYDGLEEVLSDVVYQYIFGSYDFPPRDLIDEDLQEWDFAICSFASKLMRYPDLVTLIHRFNDEMFNWYFEKESLGANLEDIFNQILSHLDRPN